MKTFVFNILNCSAPVAADGGNDDAAAADDDDDAYFRILKPAYPWKCNRMLPAVCI